MALLFETHPVRSGKHERPFELLNYFGSVVSDPLFNYKKLFGN